MAQKQYAYDLGEAGFSMLSENQPRTVLSNYIGKSNVNATKPGLMFCHNVMPTAEGYTSVGYTEIVAASAAPNMILVLPIHAEDKSRCYLGWDSNNNVYALNNGSTAWEAITGEPVVSPFSADVITTGKVGGVTYIFYANTGCYTYNSSTKSFTAKTLTSLTVANILGITSSSGYLIAYDATSIAWSSTVDPTDFTPSDITGAGSGQVTDIQGDITFCAEIATGFIVYTTTNAVSATYTGNPLYPFKLREIPSAGGLSTLSNLAYSYNSAQHVVYTKSGLQILNTQKAELMLPEVTDFLAGSRIEDINESTLAFTTTDLTTALNKKLRFIADRYIVISYGQVGYTHALVYDLSLQRLGKLKVVHNDVIEYLGSQINPAKQSLAFVEANGTINYLDTSPADSDATGVIIFGKLQESHTRVTTLQEVDLENIPDTSAVTVSGLYTTDGKNFTVKASTLLSSSTNTARYGIYKTAVNHSIAIVGRFVLNTVLLTYSVAGRR